MDTISRIFENLGFMAYIIIAVFVLYFIGLTVYTLKSKGKQNEWLEEHPEAAKIYLSFYISCRVLSSNAYQQIGFEGIRQVVYALPGTVDLEAQYQYTTRGLLGRKTYTYGPIRLSLNVESNKNYTLTFNKKTEAFELLNKN